MGRPRAPVFAVLAAMSFIVAGLSSAVAEQSTLDVVKQRGTLIAGVKSDYPPFGYVDQNGNLVGFDVEIMKYLAKYLGVQIDLRPVTSANRIPMLQAGTVDVVCASMGITKDRVQAVDFTVPYALGRNKVSCKEGQWHKGLRGSRRQNDCLYAGNALGRGDQARATQGQNLGLPG